MHEFSLAEGLIKAVREEMVRHQPLPGKLQRIRVVVGEMRQVVPETLRFAYQTLARGTEAEGSELVIEPKPTAAECRDCSWTGPIENHLFICKQCESTNITIISGKELFLSSMEFDKNE